MTSGRSVVSSAPAVSLSAVRKSYGGGRSLALDDVSFELPTGSVCGLLGPNGCGKTTLAKVISGATTCDSGRVRVLGHDPATSSRAEKLEISVMHQRPTFDMMLTVRDNLRVGAVLKGVPWRRARGEALQLLDVLGGAGIDLDQPMFTLSGGETKRVQFVRTLLGDPRLVLLDEPTAGLDADGKDAFWAFLHGLRRDRDTTILWTTHLLDEVEQNCDSALILVRGRVASFLERSDFESSGTAVRVSVGEPILARTVDHIGHLLGRRVYGSGYFLTIPGLVGHDELAVVGRVCRVLDARPVGANLKDVYREALEHVSEVGGHEV